MVESGGTLQKSPKGTETAGNRGTEMYKQQHKEFTKLKYRLKDHFCHLNSAQQ